MSPQIISKESELAQSIMSTLSLIIKREHPPQIKGGSMRKTILILITLTLNLFSFKIFAQEAKNEYKAEMSCSVYKTRVENKVLKESTLIFQAKGQPFTIGYYQVADYALPSPFQNVSIHFEHFISHYNETGPSGASPFVIANFKLNNEDKGFSRTNFDFVNPEAGTKVLLRNTLNYSPELMLSYQCTLTVVK